ncbi:hypothetical protein HU200_017202 [Digitaria exilis]|uniref:Nuclear transcription factor Y subunit n=1 Tax=Digitaria exilis TaxID=1010633 RepID=A0A835F7M2_9POAL|nr:hypothetical protein HU200_017202 [Digitaria exilis]
MRSTLNFDNKQPLFASQDIIDYSQPITCISYPYNDSASGVWAAYGSRTSGSNVFYPQISGGASARIPLPLELAENEPIYVNPKQYRGILRRRQLRAKLEAQNKLAKARKPYLHESRHLHALKRARGSGGRFLNTKQLQQQQASTRSTPNGTCSSGSTHLRLGGGAAGDQTLTPKAVASQDNSNKSLSSSAPAFTTVTPILLRDEDDAFFQHPSHHISFTTGHFGQASAQGGMQNGTQQRVPVMR